MGAVASPSAASESSVSPSGMRDVEASHCGGGGGGGGGGAVDGGGGSEGGFDVHCCFGVRVMFGRLVER